MSNPYSQPPYPQAPGYTGGMPIPTPRKKRGTKRIILGSLALLTGAVFLVVGPLLGGMVGGIITGASLFSNAQIIENGSSVHVTEGTYAIMAAGGAESCNISADPQGVVTVGSPENSSLTLTKNGQEFTMRNTATATGDADITVNCTNATAVAVAPISGSPLLIGLAIGGAVAVLFGLIGLVLLISGIVGRSRSSRGL